MTDREQAADLRPGSEPPHARRLAARAWTARFSDGHSAATVTGVVQFDTRSQEIVFTGDDGLFGMRLAFDDLVTSGPVRRRNTDVLLQSQATLGATLFVDDASFASALLEEVPHLGRKAHLWRFARPAMVMGVVLAAIIGGAWALDVRPAQTMAGWLPIDFRRQMATGMVETLERRHPACHTTKGRAALDRLVSRFLAADPDIAFERVIVLPMNVVNAFALPGGTLILTKGLIEQAAGPEEVAGVLAHELGHAKLLHPEAGLVRHLGIALVADLVLAGSSDALTSAGTLLLQLNYTRDAEREADDEALRLLALTEIDPTPLQVFMERLQAKERGRPTGSTSANPASPAPNSDAGDGEKNNNARPTSVEPEAVAKSPETADDPSRVPSGGGLLSALSTHPATAERIRTIASAPRYPTQPAMSAQDWAALSAICQDGS